MHTEEEFSKKITFVSFVSALLAVLIHAYWVSLSYTLSDDFLYIIVIGIEKFINFPGNSYALTMFFAISSILFFRNVNDENLNRKLASRAKSLLIPYFVWNILYTLFFYVTGNLLHFSSEIVELGIADFLKALFCHKYLQTFWYMSDLIIFTAIAPIIFHFMKCIKEKRMHGFWLVAYVGGD